MSEWPIPVPQTPSAFHPHVQQIASIPAISPSMGDDVDSSVPDIIDAIKIKGAAFCIEYGFFEYAEEMLAELGCEASASLAATGLKQRLRDNQIAFWQERYNLASVVTARFPNYQPGRFYVDLCCSRIQSSASQSEGTLLTRANREQKSV